jgi:hypothetical protein
MPILKDSVYEIDGQVWKKHSLNSKYKITFPIFEKYELDFLPKLLEWNNEGYVYEYIDKPTIMQANTESCIINQKMILEIKMAMDDIWKKLYQISIENLEEGYYLWYNDPHLDNLIWFDDSKKLILLDIDCFEIGRCVPISFMNNFLIQNLESQFTMRKLCEPLPTKLWQ